MAVKNYCYTDREIRIIGVSADLRKEIKNIALNKGVTMSKFVSQNVDGIIEAHRKLLSTEPCAKTYDLKIRGVSKQKKIELMQIASALNMDFSDFVKKEIFNVANTYPENMKVDIIG